MKDILSNNIKGKDSGTQIIIRNNIESNKQRKKALVPRLLSVTTLKAIINIQVTDNYEQARDFSWREFSF